MLERRRGVPLLRGVLLVPLSAEPVTSTVSGVTVQLRSLVELAEQGVLSEQEFVMAKARLLTTDRLPA